MRKMQDFIVKGKKVYVGLEDSKRTWKLCVRCEDMVVHRASMPTEYENLKNYLLNNYPMCQVKVGYEAGFQGFWLRDKLEGDGIDCIVIPPTRVTVEKRRRVKTDKIDAFRLAVVLEKNDAVACFVPDKELREDRQISRTLIGIQKDNVRVRNRIRKFLDFHGLNNGLPDGEWSDAVYNEVKSLEVIGSLRTSLNILFAELDHVRNARKQLLAELRKLATKERYRETVKVLKTAPGIGWQTAIRLVLEWGEDLSRFGSAQRMGSYCGLTASENSTGDDVRRGHITRESSPHVRAWLVEAAWTAIRKDPVLLAKFRDVRSRSGSSKKAIVAVARKLAVRLRYIAVNKRTYCVGTVQ